MYNAGLSYVRLMSTAVDELTTSPTPGLDARLLMQSASELDYAELIAQGDELVPDSVAQSFLHLVKRRQAQEPIAHILGVQEFYSRSFKVTPQTLIPRPETEMLVDAVLARAARPSTLLDLGTGSGCLLISLLCELPEATGVAIDISPAALKVARENGRQHEVADRVVFREADFAAAPKGPFDVIVANPPYIGTHADLPVSVDQFEPALALRAGPDGLDAYRVLAPVIAKRLAPDGAAFLEIGTGQGKAVSELMKEAMPDWDISVHQDLAGHERMVAIMPA